MIGTTTNHCIAGHVQALETLSQPSLRQPLDRWGDIHAPWCPSFRHIGPSLSRPSFPFYSNPGRVTLLQNHSPITSAPGAIGTRRGRIPRLGRTRGSKQPQAFASDTEGRQQKPGPNILFYSFGYDLSDSFLHAGTRTPNKLRETLPKILKWELVSFLQQTGHINSIT